MAFEIPEYTIEDFRELQYPIFEVPEDSTIMEYLGDSDLDDPEFKVTLGKHGFKPGDKDKVIRYIACVYDQGSPFIKDFQDVNHRKIAAALYVGFEIDSKKRFPEAVEQMMLGDMEVTVDMIIRYVRNYNSPDYSFLVAIWDDYYRTLKQIQIGGDYSFDQIKKMREEIKKLTKEFVSGDTVDGVRKKLYKEIEQDSLLLRPEDIAEKLEDGVQAITDTEIQDYRSPNISEVQQSGD
jgi:hypothetical protein